MKRHFGTHDPLVEKSPEFFTHGYIFRGEGHLNLRLPSWIHEVRSSGARCRGGYLSTAFLSRSSIVLLKVRLENERTQWILTSKCVHLLHFQISQDNEFKEAILEETTVILESAHENPTIKDTDSQCHVPIRTGNHADFVTLLIQSPSMIAEVDLKCYKEDMNSLNRDIVR